MQVQPSCTFRNGQRESVYSENCLLTATNKVMTTGFQSDGVQHGFVNQSYRQPSLSQTIPNLSKEPYVSTLMVRIFYKFLLFKFISMYSRCSIFWWLRWGVMYNKLGELMDQQISILIFEITAFIFLCTHQLITSFLFKYI